MVGADPRLPAIAMSPQSRKDTTMPMTETSVACQNEMPKPRTNEPYDMPNTDTFAATRARRGRAASRSARIRG